jgi:hypothetical protein
MRRRLLAGALVEIIEPRSNAMRDVAQAEDKPMVEPKPREERIREAAYRRYLARSDAEGDAWIDWTEAEAEIDAEDAGLSQSTKQGS